jgi:hypothetical protein
MLPLAAHNRVLQEKLPHCGVFSYIQTIPCLCITQQTAPDIWSGIRLISNSRKLKLIEFELESFFKFLYIILICTNVNCVISNNLRFAWRKSLYVSPRVVNHIAVRQVES